MKIWKDTIRYSLSSDSDLLIMGSSASHPILGLYIRVALCEVQKGVTPKTISERAQGVRRIVKIWGEVAVEEAAPYVCARAFKSAQRMAKSLGGKPLKNLHLSLDNTSYEE